MRCCRIGRWRGCLADWYEKKCCSNVSKGRRGFVAEGSGMFAVVYGRRLPILDTSVSLLLDYRVILCLDLSVSSFLSLITLLYSSKVLHLPLITNFTLQKYLTFGPGRLLSLITSRQPPRSSINRLRSQPSLSHPLQHISGPRTAYPNSSEGKAIH